MNMGLFETDERISPENIENVFQRVDYERHRFAYDSVKNFVLEGSKVLEVGCGEGYGAHFLAHSGFSVVAVDVDTQLEKYATAKYGMSDSLKYITIVPDALPFEDDYFDAVVSFQVIEHTHNIEKYLSEISRVLKKDGVFLCTTPNRLLRLSAKQKPWNEFHVTEFYPLQLKRMMNNFFTEVELCGVFGNLQVSRLEYERLFFLKQKELHDYFRKLFFEFLWFRLVRKLKIKRTSNFSDVKNTKRPYFRLGIKKMNVCVDIFTIAKK